MENNDKIDEILKDSTLSNPDLTFCEKTTYLDFLLSNAQSNEEEEEIKQVVNNFLELSSDDEPVDDEEDSE